MFSQIIYEISLGDINLKLKKYLVKTKAGAQKENPVEIISSHCVVWYLLFLRDSIFGSLNYGITSFITALFLSVNDLLKNPNVTLR